MKDQFILKDRLRSLIGEGRVKAALFYTFNFDPKFFENYVMPLLVPEQQFNNNAINNNIIWRKLYKDGVVPPITLYCDQYAKSIEHGPMLDYRIVEVSMPSVGKNKGNFHPKNSFILVEQENGVEALIVLTGSNNLTQGGWCENRECVAEQVLVNGAFFPEGFKKDIRSFMLNIADLYNPSSSEAEERILQYLNRQKVTSDRNFSFYDSFQGSFPEFLEDYVLEDPTVDTVEIISPFLKADTELVAFFREKGLNVRIEAPFAGEYCLLEASLFDAYQRAGVEWHGPCDIRHVHSKVYRFYGQGKVYTIVGSVNFTAPAWNGWVERPRAVYNIESAILYTEKCEKRVYLLKRPLKEEPPFLPIQPSMENSFEERMTAPPLSFIINWATATLQWRGKLSTPCRLFLTEAVQLPLSNRGEQPLLELTHGKEIVEALTRHTLLKVIETVGQEERIHYYYPNQEGFAQKPLEYRLSATDILQVWELLGREDKVLNEWLINRLELCTDLAQDESGRIVEEVSPHKSLLNEMARHLYGLIKLEEYLFDEKVLKKSERQKRSHGNDLRYYLTHDNVDTLLSYGKDLQKLHAEEKLLGGYYWILLSIMRTKFYGHPLLPKLIKECIAEERERKTFKGGVQEKLDELATQLAQLERQLQVDKKKLKWALDTLTLDYATTE